MNDVLGRLVDRAFDAGGGLRPRSATRFETPALQAFGQPAAEWRDDAPASDGDAADQPFATPPAARTVISAPVPGPSGVAPPPEAAEVPGELQLTRHPRPTPRRTVAEARPAPGSRAFAGVDPAAPSPPDDAKPRTQAEPIPARAVDRRPPSVSAPVQPSDATANDLELAAVEAVRQPEPARPARRPIAPARSDAVPADGVVGHPEPAPFEAPTVVTPQMGAQRAIEGRPGARTEPLLDAGSPRRGDAVARGFAARDALEAWPEPAVGRQSRPVVHVSIGRIEVRAITPPAIPARPAAPPRSNARSLEDYLRARSRTAR